MTHSIDEINALSRSEAAEMFAACCGATAWVDRMVAGRPYSSDEELLQVADLAWNATTAADWHEAFSHHPRIGEMESAAGQGERAKQWSRAEQAGLASSNIHDQMLLVNHAYEYKFGHIYVVYAAGKSGEDLLRLARERLKNDADTELEVAAKEQRKITNRRLRELLGEES